jgi:hypothetical protein
MKPRRDITPHMSSSDSGINASLTLLKVYKRLRTIDPTYKPSSRYQAKLKNRQATHRADLRIIR